MYPLIPRSVETTFASSGFKSSSSLEASSYCVVLQQLAYVSSTSPSRDILTGLMVEVVTDEMNVTCPSNYLADIFAGGGRQLYKYQHSGTAAQHVGDLFVQY